MTALEVAVDEEEEAAEAVDAEGRTLVQGRALVMEVVVVVTAEAQVQGIARGIVLPDAAFHVTVAID